MASERQIFNLSGPKHLTAVDWENFDHRRAVAASLVQGTYVLERDRQQNRQGPHAYAPPWWDFFHFQLTSLLIDDGDGSIFGAIYEFKSYTFNHYYSAQHAPKYVIAFRGTVKKAGSVSQDLKYNLLWICNKLHESSRFRIAMEAVQNLVNKVGAPNMWLVGHSLGSAIALLAGKSMTKMGSRIATYLFNPPFFSAPVEKIGNQNVKHGILFTSSLVKAGLAVATKARHQRRKQDDAFVMLSTWLPFLFVNPADDICSGYIGYFEHRRKMDEIGAGKIERLATQTSIRTLISGAFGKDLDPLHLIPSACLTINRSKSPDFKRAHGIHQWWNPMFEFHSLVHQFR